MPISSEQARKNALIGGGRPPGSLSAETRLKIKSEKLLRKRIYRITDKLFNSQAIAAIGTHKVVVMTKKDGIVSVETVREIERIDDLIENGVYGKDYLIVAGAEPDWKAANALLDRGYGKAKESIAVDVDVKFSLKGLAQRRQDFIEGKIIEMLPAEEKEDEEL